MRFFNYDKITNKVFDEIDIIEEKKGIYYKHCYNKRKKMVLNKLTEIYMDDNVQEKDLIQRKIYLQKSTDDFNSVFVSICISGLISCFVSMITTCYFQNKNCFQITFIGFILIIPITIILFFISCVLYKMILQNRKNFDRYGTYEFEIELIDEILKNRWEDDLKKCKNNILNRFDSKDTNSRDKATETDFDVEEHVSQKNTNQTDNKEPVNEENINRADNLERES